MQTPWYLDPKKYAWFLGHVDISEDEYLLAINEVLDVFPIADAIEYTICVNRLENGIVGPFSLHPWPFHALLRHPILTFLSGQILDNHILAEIVNFGRDLYVTKTISGVASLRRDISNFEQYIGRLFELEVLAQLVRAEMSPEILGTPDFVAMLGNTNVFIEARHRGVPFGRAVTEGIILGLAFKKFGELSIRLLNVGASGESVKEVSKRIVTSIAEMLASNCQTYIVTSECEVHHTPDGEAGRLSVHYGKESYDTDIAGVIRFTLEDKEKQLESISNTDGLRVLALDVRSLFPTLPPEDMRNAIAPGWLSYYEPKIVRWQATVSEATQEFLKDTKSTDVVLLWWNNIKGRFPCQIREQFQYQNTVQIIGRNGSAFVDQPQEFQVNLSRLTQ